MDLSVSFPKDPHPLPDIDRLIDDSLGYCTLSFIDAYSRYNQIRMDLLDVPKIAFISNHDNYYYNVMPLRLKNTDATYQRLMDAVFTHQIGQNLEVYVDDMIIKIEEEHSHADDLEDILQSVRRYDMRLNLVKCSSGVQAGKFLGFMLTMKGIEANPYKCRAVIDMRSPTSV